MSRKLSPASMISGLAAALALATATPGAGLQSVPRLEPSANRVKVRTVAELVDALAKAVKGRSILLADGIYDVSAVEPLRIRTDSVTLIGESGDPTKAILKGQGFTSANVDEEMIKIEASSVTLAHLTLRDVRANALKIQTGGNHNLLVHNVHFIDICERAIKGPDVPASRNGVVRYCLFEQKTPITAGIPNLRFEGDYIAGMDMMKIEDWRIHDNTFRNIKGRTGGGRAAIFLWKECRNVIVERNFIIGCDRAISLGNPSSAVSDMTGAVIRNNFIVAGTDISLEICNTSQSLIANNTVWSANPLFNRTISFYNGGQGNLMRNNLILGRLSVQGGVLPDSAGNLMLGVVGAAAGWFKDPANGDLHLTPLAIGAVDKGRPLEQITDDFDTHPRDAKPDIGADELGSSPTSTLPPRQGRGEAPSDRPVSGLAGNSWGLNWKSTCYGADGGWHSCRTAPGRPY